MRGGVAGELRLERRRVPLPTTATTSCSSPTTRRASATSRTSARRGGRASSWAERSRVGTLTLGANYTCSTRPIAARRPSTARGNSSNDARGRLSGRRRHHRDPARRSHPAGPAPDAQAVSPTATSTRRGRSALDMIAVERLLRARQRERPAPARRRSTTSARASSAGYAVFNLDADYRPTPRLQALRAGRTTCSTAATTRRRSWAPPASTPTATSWRGRSRPMPTATGRCSTRRSTRRARRARSSSA